ncbi:MAG: hypothetical protein IJC06_04140 [Clostridia bacterium]|nr:hypothetical protein [Clostridia bacterium]
MAKRIVGYSPIGDGTRDRGENMVVYELFDDRIEKIQTNAFGIKKDTISTYMINEIEIDCFRNAGTQNNSAEGALLGGVLFGVAGAVIGGLTGLKADAWYCEIKKGDIVEIFRFNSEADKNSLLKWYEKNR